MEMGGDAGGGWEFGIGVERECGGFVGPVETPDGFKSGPPGGWGGEHDWRVCRRDSDD